MTAALAFAAPIPRHGRRISQLRVFTRVYASQTRSNRRRGGHDRAHRPAEDFQVDLVQLRGQPAIHDPSTLVGLADFHHAGEELSRFVDGRFSDPDQKHRAGLEPSLAGQLKAGAGDPATRTNWDAIGASAGLSTAAHTAYHFGAIRQILAGLNK
jgi:hypothetical protein